MLIVWSNEKQRALRLGSAYRNGRSCLSPRDGSHSPVLTDSPGATGNILDRVTSGLRRDKTAGLRETDVRT